MTCFWDGLLKKLKPVDFVIFFNKKYKPKCDEFVMLIKSNNIKTSDVKCDGQILTDQDMENNIARINRIKKIVNGYDCSSCDPVLLLVSQLFIINIVHNFNGANIEYMNENATRTIHLRSDNDHMF